MKTLHEILKSALRDNPITASQEAQQKWIAYLNHLTAWNRVFNLTTITSPHDMVYLHLIDSLLTAPFVTGPRCLDVGSGAGLPGIPLAILHPEQAWTLLDKNNKKTRFLTQMAAELSLSNVEVIHSRAEDFHPSSGFDSILSRAYGTLALFAETTSHLLSETGTLIAMKGRYPEEELAALPAAFEVICVERLNLKGMTLERHMVCLKRRK